GVLPQTNLRLQVSGLCYRSHRRTINDRVGSPHVCHGLGSPAVLLPDDYADCSPHRCEVRQLDRYHVARVDYFRNANVVEPRVHGHLPVWWFDRCYLGRTSTGLPGLRYLLRGCTLPLRSLRYRCVRHVRWLLLLVAQIHRKDAQRNVGQDPVLDGVPRLPLSLPGAALARLHGYATSLRRLHGGGRFHNDEPILCRLVDGARRVNYSVPLQHLLHRSLRQDGNRGRPMGLWWLTRVGDFLSTTSSQLPCTAKNSFGTPSSGSTPPRTHSARTSRTDDNKGRGLA